jgi:hypothetical protein
MIFIDLKIHRCITDYTKDKSPSFELFQCLKLKIDCIPFSQGYYEENETPTKRFLISRYGKKVRGHLIH